MLANDSVTVAVEVPIWLAEADIAALEAQHRMELVPKNGTPRSITGHIDFLQVRNGAVHILDYKPDGRAVGGDVVDGVGCCSARVDDDVAYEIAEEGF
jgi:hypothetical protein